MEKDYYVYSHSLPDGTVFYIGKGRQNRAFSKKGRTERWRSVLGSNPLMVTFLNENLSFSEAEDKEVEYLSDPVPTWKLVNKQIDTRALQILPVIHHVYYDVTSPTFLRWKFETAPGKRKTGGVAGCVYSNKYATVSINSKPYFAHRLIWVLFNKTEIPRGYVINHIDCNPSNNSIDNLELVTYAENNKRKSCHIGRLCSNNKSGINRVRETVTKPRGGCVFYNVTVVWYENSKQRNKSFAYLKYGKEEAWRLAIEFNNNLIANGK